MSPTGWPTAPLRRMAKIRAGAGFPIHLQGVSDDTYPFFKVNCLAQAGPDGVIRDTYDTVSRQTADLLGAAIIPAGSMVMAKIGAALNLGRIRVLSQDSCIDNNMLALTPRRDVDARYLFYALHDLEMETLVNPGAVPSLSERALRGYQLPQPSVEVQTRIADFLDRETAKVDGLVDAAKWLLRLLEERRSARVVTEVLGGYAQATGGDWLPPLPERWERGRIKSVAIGVTDGAHISPVTELGTHDFVSTRDVKNGSIDFAGSLKTDDESYRYMVRTGCQPVPGDVLFSKDGTVGETAVVPEGHSFVVASSLVIIRPHAGRIDSNYLRYVLGSTLVTEQAYSMMRGAGLPRLSVANLARLEIPIPPIEVQVAIATRLAREADQVEQVVSRTRQSIALAQERRSALITAAVTGQIDVGRVA